MMYIQKNIYKMLILIRRVYNILLYKNTSVNINSILFSKKQHTQKPPSPFYFIIWVIIMHIISISPGNCYSYGIIQSTV